MLKKCVIEGITSFFIKEEYRENSERISVDRLILLNKSKRICILRELRKNHTGGLVRDDSVEDLGGSVYSFR